MTNIMVDLETLSTSMDAQILTIGAVAFDFWGNIKDEFYLHVDLKSCEELKLRKDEATVKWWESQTDDARKEAFKSENRVPIKEVILQFNKFWNKNKGEKLWCNGANFDEPILSTVYERLKMEKPWKFWNVRCLRTYLAVVGTSMNKFGFIAHNALTDCKNQVEAYKHVTQTLSRY
jgi:hypothetical protein